MHKLTARDLQDIGLAQHAETYVKQEQRNQSESGANSSVNTKSGLENRESKRKRVREAKRKYVD